jgi:hypothetical protein
VTLTLVDGGPGDDGGLLDGKILDPSGLGTATASSVSSSPAADSNTFGSGGGGSTCFIAASADGRPATLAGSMIGIIAIGLALSLVILAGFWYTKTD